MIAIIFKLEWRDTHLKPVSQSASRTVILQGAQSNWDRKTIQSITSKFTIKMVLKLLFKC